ncbi:MAG: LemA family protein [Erysipelotrichaceae bacterium]|nr:LemA family protein [Erysipelotrichaceae bacterium]
MQYIIILIALVLVYLVMMHNSIVYAAMKVEESKSGIDVALSKRYAILTNMQESVKGYVKHESEVLQQVTKIRKAMSLQQLSNANEQMNQLKSRLIALAESYPDLKASDLFRQFQDSIVDCEDHLQAARRFYNSNVTLYNKKLLMFPTSIIASWMKKEKAEFFEAAMNEKGYVSVKI